MESSTGNDDGEFELEPVSPWRPKLPRTASDSSLLSEAKSYESAGEHVEHVEHVEHIDASETESVKTFTADEEKAVIRKVDRHLVLFLAFLYMLSFLDRSSE